MACPHLPILKGHVFQTKAFQIVPFFRGEAQGHVQGQIVDRLAFPFADRHVVLGKDVGKINAILLGRKQIVQRRMQLVSLS